MSVQEMRSNDKDKEKHQRYSGHGPVTSVLRFRAKLELLSQSDRLPSASAASSNFSDCLLTSNEVRVVR